MKAELKKIEPIPQPPDEVVVTMTTADALTIKSFLGHLSGPHAAYAGDGGFILRSCKFTDMVSGHRTKEITDMMYFALAELELKG